MVAEKLNRMNHQPPGLRRAEGGLRLLRDLGRAARPGGRRLHHAETLAEEGAQRRLEVRLVVPSQTEIDSPKRLEKIGFGAPKSEVDSASAALPIKSLCFDCLTGTIAM